MRFSCTLDGIFYKIIKREMINEASFTCIDQAQLEMFKYTETYCNNNRLHSALNYQSLGL
ncbi:IS3 family transposase [Enterococcus pallens]|uniref:IS3 family transposase n=1 Tax=Enterococcus pallens TaxID=160454 RepID=UPI001B8021AE